MGRFIFFFLLYSLTFAQSEDPLKYFPIKTGNMWEYFFYDLEYPDTVQVFNIKDSVDAEGNIYVTQFARRIHPIQEPLLFTDTAHYRIDTAYNVYAPPGMGGGSFITEEGFILYKLDANEGEQWVVFDYSTEGGDGYELARVERVWGRRNIFWFRYFYHF